MDLAFVILCMAGMGIRMEAQESAKALDAEAQSAVEIKEKVYAEIPAEEEVGFIRMPPPQKGDWMAHFRESPQPLAKYQIQSPHRPTAERKTIVLQPLGTFGERETKALGVLRVYTAQFFQLPVRIAEALPMPDPAKDEKMTRILPVGRRHGTYERQYNASRILDQVLSPRLPKDAIAYLGITMEDLWDDNLSFLFGLGSFKDRVGVYSLCRYYPEFWGEPKSPEADKLALLRSLKLLNHESGHMFGLSHCVFYRCSMNGTNSLKETDRAPVHYCPVCQRKLHWNVGYDASKRFAELEALYREHGFEAEAQWMAGRKARWDKLAVLKSEDEEE